MTSRLLVRALARSGLEPSGPLGAGAGGARWAARDAAGRTWAVTVVGADDAARPGLRRRVAALAALDHPHVAEVAPLVELRDGTAAVLQAEVAGPDLRTVRAARDAWTPGEVATLLVPLAEALAAMHAAGVAHGDVAPGNVVLEPDGRPVLVDVVGGAGPGEAGTPGLAAPERVRGASPAGDVHALARLGLALLGDAAARVDDRAADPRLTSAAVDRASADDLTSVDDDTREIDAHRVALLAVLRAAADADPARRPDAGRLAAQVYGACPPSPVRMPDAAVLARLTLRGLAVPGGDVTVRLTTPPEGPPARGRHRVPTGRDAPERHGARGGRARRARGAGVVLLTGLALAAVVAGVGHAWDAPPPEAAGAGGGTREAAGILAVPGHPGPPGPPRLLGQAGPAADRDASHPLVAAVRLTEARVAALAAGDRAALAAVTVPGSPAAAADVRAAAALRGRGPAAGEVDVSGVRLLAVVGADGATTARVLVRARAVVRTADEQADADPAEIGEPELHDPGTDQAGALLDGDPAPAVVLVLVRTADGWRVSAVEPPPPAT